MTDQITPLRSDPTRVVVVSAGLGVPSSTRLLGDRLADAVIRAAAGAAEGATRSLAPVEVEVVELRPLAHALADHLLTGFPGRELGAALEAVRRADAVIAVTPVFTASYSGLFKTFFDVLEPDALRGVPVLVAATAGTARHSLVLDHALRPLFAYLRAVVVPTGVFAASEDFGSAGLAERVDRAAAELVMLLGGAAQRAATGSGGPAGPTGPEDPFADPVPFEELLRRA